MKNAHNGKSLPNIVADQIIEYILENNLEAGDKLPNEYAIATMLGTSRGTVREAIRRLMSRNILTVRQGSGTFISQRRGIPEDPLGITFIGNDPALALELSDLRLMVEPCAAEMAARNANAEEIEEMERLCQKIGHLANANKPYIDIDLQLHCLIGKCCGNSILKNLIFIMAEASEISIRITKNKYNDRAFDEHWQIVQAIRRGDSFGARYAMEAHLNTGRQHIAMLKSLGSKEKKESQNSEE